MLTIRTLLFAVPLLPFALAACADADVAGDDSTDVIASSVTVRTGVDYSWSRPSPQTLFNSGYTFAARYLSYDTSGKNLTLGEANALRAAGVDVVANWEYGAQDALNGYDEGVRNAQTALAQANAAGMPAGRPIYFSVDFDATPGQQAAINSYFDGVISVLGVARTGAYAGYYPIKRLFDAGKIQWGWQTYAWSGGQWDPRAQVRQVQNGVTIGGADCDIDAAQTDDFGQWGAGHADSPAAEPAPGAQTGDFNGDGRSEIAMFYDYGNDNAGLWLFSADGTTPRMTWSSGPGNWAVSRTKFVTGDFDGDGRSEIAALYDYGNDSVGLWLFSSDGTSPRRTWMTNPGSWGWNRSKLVAGDFDGDGRSEIAVLYDYSNDVTGLWLFNADGTSPRRTWVTNPGGWGWNRSKLTVGDFNGDGRSETAVFYDYSNDNSGLFYFNSEETAAQSVFLSGAGNWGWARSLLGG